MRSFASLARLVRPAAFAVLSVLASSHLAGAGTAPLADRIPDARRALEASLDNSKRAPAEAPARISEVSGRPSLSSPAARSQPAPEAISATTYPFTFATGVALEDMATGTTTLVAASSDDGASALTSMGIEFWFNGVRYTTFSASANGYVRLGAAATTGSTSYTNNFASTTAEFPLIAPYWDDLYTGSNGKVHAKVVGTAPNRKLVVEWLNEIIPRVATGGTGAGTFQAWLFETSGKIQFVYGNGIAANSGGASVGFAASSTVFASVTATATPTVSYATSNNTNTAAIAATTSYTFTPPVPAAPTNLTFTNVSPSQVTLNWTDNSSNELGFPIYLSADNVTFSYLGQAGAGATSINVTGLSPSTTYYFRVYAVTEGALSTALAGSQATTAPTANSSVATGLWSAAATWSTGVVPTAGDAVTISAGTTVTIDVASTAYSVSVANTGVLQFEQTTARTLTVGTSVTVQSGGTFQSNAAGTVTTHTLSLAGSLTNNGVLDFSTNANTAGAGITFTGGGAATFGGSGGTTDVRTVTVNKGTSNANILELNPANFTVQGVATDVAGWLTLTNGTLKLSGTFAGTNRVFSAVAYTIPATAGFWLNNANYVVAAQVGNGVNNGLLRVSQGVFNQGTLASHSLRGGTGAVFTFDGGTINCAGQFSPQSAVTYNQSAGTLNVGIVGTSQSNFGTFELFSASSVFNMTGGSIVVQQASTGTTQIDVQNLASVTAANGTLQIGSAATATKFTFTVIGSLPNLVIDGTTNPKTATATAQVNVYGNTTISAGSTFNLGGFLGLFLGTTFTNNGILTGTTAGSRLYFLGGAGAATYTGSGVVTAPLASLDVDNVAGLTIAPSVNPIVTLRVNIFSGGITGSGKITIGNGGSTTASVQLGVAGVTAAVTGFDVPPVFNPGTGGVNLFYAPELTGRTTGNEVPPSRTLAILQITNTNPITIAGGDITVNGTTAGALALGAARVITGANTLYFNPAATTGTVTRSTGYVDGNFKKAYAAAGSQTFEVGTANGYSPVTVNATAGTFPADVTVAAKQGVAPFVSGNALARYWTLTAPASLTANLTFNYLATDVTGNVANYQFLKNVGGTVTVIPPSAPPTTTQATLNGATAITADWTLGEAVPAIAVADGATPLTDGTSTVDFGSVNVGSSASKTFTISNPGSAPLVLGAITVDGANAADFAAGTPGTSTVAPGGSTTFTVTFTPSAANARNAAVHIATNVSGAASSFDFNVTGNGVIPNVPPQITSANTTTFQINAFGSFQVTATGSPAPTFTYTGTLPAGVTLTSAGLLSGTPTQGGTFPITITASNGTPPNATQNFTLIVNRPPVAGADSMSTRRNVAATITSGRLRLNDSDPDGDPLSVTGVTPASAQGGTVSLSGVNGVVTYTPPTNFTGTDSFSYQLADNRGGSASGTVTVTVTPGDDQSLRNVSVSRDQNGTATVVFAGVPGYAYQVQYQDTMNGPWTNAGPPITADAQGRVIYVDPNSPPTRFYRAIAP